MRCDFFCMEWTSSYQAWILKKRFVLTLLKLLLSLCSGSVLVRGLITNGSPGQTWYWVVTLSLHFVTETSTGKKVSKAGSSSIQRSVETGMAVEYPRGGSAMNRQASRESTDGSMNSYSSEGKYVPFTCWSLKTLENIRMTLCFLSDVW